MTARSLLERAEAFATRAHEGQQRKFSGKPYIVHPSRVVTTLRGWLADEETQAAGWLHDVVEDCGVQPDNLRREFGARVADLVLSVTKPDPATIRYEDVPTGWEGNRRRAAAVLAMRCLEAEETPPEAVVLKAADRIDNLRDYPVPKLGWNYIAEAAELLRIVSVTRHRYGERKDLYDLLGSAELSLRGCILERLRLKGEWL